MESLGIFPFLPLVQDRDSGTVTLLETGLSGETARRGLSLLLRRGLVAIDNQAPLENYDYSPYQHHLLGSVGLTLLGQETLDDLEYGGNNASFLF